MSTHLSLNLISTSQYVEDRKITMKDLEESAKEEVGKNSSRIGFRRQDSEAARMYN